MATCVRCDNEFELVGEWQSTMTEASGERVTLIYRSLVCDACLTEAEAEQREKWAFGDPVDPIVMGLDPRPERRLSEVTGGATQ